MVEGRLQGLDFFTSSRTLSDEQLAEVVNKLGVASATVSSVCIGIIMLVESSTAGPRSACSYHYF